MKVQLQCALRHSLTAVMRSEALKTHGSEALPRHGLPGNCCYATAEGPIKVQRVACWGWTAPQCSECSWAASFLLKPWSTQDMRRVTANASTLHTFLQEEKRKQSRKQATMMHRITDFQYWSLYCMWPSTYATGWQRKILLCMYDLRIKHRRKNETFGLVVGFLCEIVHSHCSSKMGN